ncbi:hypothetical protein ABD72_22600 [Brevibacillus laterosporus]|nr:hypothetical protein [Brevibacillus laterosporus]TPH09986.1 hypothetical protein EGH09_21775 [Brevibacillus laterosporus]
MSKYVVFIACILISIALITSVSPNFAILLGISPALFYIMKAYENSREKKPFKSDLISALLIIVVVPIAFLIVISQR